MNERAEDIAPKIGTCMHYERYERKIFFDVPEGIGVEMPKGLAHVLGFQEETVLNRDSDSCPKDASTSTVGFMP